MRPLSSASNRSRVSAIQSGILRAALSVGVAGIAVKLIAVGKEIFVAAAFARSDAMDAFVAAILIPNLLVNLIAETMNQALLPTLIRVHEREGRESAQRLLSSSMLWMCVLLVAVSLAMAAAAQVVFPLIASNFSPAKRALAEKLFYALLPMVVLSGIATNCTAVLNSLGRFAAPALAPALISLTIIAVVGTASARYGIWTLVAATVFGTLLQMALVVGLMQRRGYCFSLHWYGSNEALREVGHQYGPVLLSAVVASGGLLVDQAMAAWLPAGSVSALAYAGRFVSVVLTLVAGAIATAVVPALARLIAHEDWSGCRLTVRHWRRLTFLVSAPLALLLIFGARPLISLALEHGHFYAADTEVVAGILCMYALQIPFYAASRVDYRLILAARRSDLILACGIVNLVLDVVLNLVLMRTMGVAGIALATSLWTVSTFLFLRYWSRRLIREGEALLEVA